MSSRVSASNLIGKSRITEPIQTGSGSVNSNPPTTPQSIARWADSQGAELNDSLPTIDDYGNIETADNTAITNPGTLTVEADTQLVLGVPGNTILGDSTERDVYPQTDLKINLGQSSKRFNNVYAATVIADAITVDVGTSTSTRKTGGALTADSQARTHSAGARSTIRNITVPANTFVADGDSLEWYVFGIFAANANAKRLDAEFGGTPIFDTTSLAQNDGDWELRVNIMRYASGARVIVNFYLIAAAMTMANSITFTTFIPTWTNSNSLLLYGTGVASSDVIAYISRLNHFPV